MKRCVFKTGSVALAVCSLVSLLLVSGADAGPPLFTQRAAYRSEVDQAGTSFGESVSLSPNGDVLCMSNFARTGTGGIWVVNRSTEYADSSPKLLVYVTGEADHVQSGFPCELSANGNALFFSGFVDAGGGDVSGATWIFKKNATGGYNKLQRLVDPGAVIDGGYGLAVSSSDDGLTFAVFRPYSTPPAALIYGRAQISDSFTLQTSSSGLALTGNAGTTNAIVIALSGDGNRVFFSSDEADSGKGCLMYYRRTAPTTWTLVSRMTEPTTGFGTTVGVTYGGEFLAVGTRGTELNSIFVYKLNTGTNQYASLQVLNTASRQLGDVPAWYSLTLSQNKLVISDRTGQGEKGVITTFTFDYSSGRYTTSLSQVRTFTQFDLRQVGNDMDISRDGQVLVLSGKSGTDDLDGVFVLSLDTTNVPTSAPVVPTNAPSFSPTTKFSPTVSPVTKSPGSSAAVVPSSSFGTLLASVIFLIISLTIV